jgi:hypothetical protein
MKLFIYDSTKGTINEIEGTPYPGKDANGDICYENTHFKTEAEAWQAMIAEVAAWVSLSGNKVALARSRLRDFEEKAATCCVQYFKAQENYRRWLQESNHQIHRPDQTTTEEHKQASPGPVQ